MSIFQQGAFTNDANMTPDQIKRKRELIAAMMPRFGSAKYVGEGIGQLATGFMAGRANKRMDKAEAAGRKSAEDMLASMFPGQGGASGGSGGGYGGGGYGGSYTPPTALPKADLGGVSGMGNAGIALPGAAPADMGMVGNGGLSFGGTKLPPGQAEIRAGLIDRGYSEAAADGIMMNMADESGFNPAAIGDNGNALGLAQWNGPRKAALEAFAAQQGKSPTDVGVQLDFLDQELKGSEAGAGTALMAAKTAPEAASVFLNQFERPAETHRARREAEYLGGSPSADVTASASGQPSAQPSGPGLDQLYMALQNPWISPEQKAIITSMIGQQQQASDPMSQIELEKAQLELAQMKDPGTQAPEDYTNRMFTLSALRIDPQSEEGKSYILTGKMPEAPEAAPAPMTPQERAAWRIPETDTTPYAMVDGLPKPISGGGVTVNNDLGGNGAKPLGNEGQILVPDPTDPSGYRVELAPGSKAAMEAEAASNKSNLSADKTSATADVVLGKLDELDTLLSGSSAINPATGFGAETAANIGGTRAADTKAVIDTISGNLSFDNLAAMRASSPTGGALGAISDREITLLSSTLASLSQKQSPEQLARNVKQLREIYTTIKQKADAYPGAGAYGFGNTPDATAGAGVPEGIDPAVWAVMTPEERALWP